MQDFVVKNPVKIKLMVPDQSCSATQNNKIQRKPNYYLQYLKIKITNLINLMCESKWEIKFKKIQNSTILLINICSEDTAQKGAENN